MQLGNSNESSPGVITVPDNDPESMVYDDAPDDFGNERFKLDYSAILDKSNKIYEDNYDIETASASTSKSTKVTIKKRALSTNSAKNKRQRHQGSITNLLQLSESEDDKGNSIFIFLILCLLILINSDHLLYILDDSYEHSESSDEDEDNGDNEDKEIDQVLASHNSKKGKYCLIYLTINLINIRQLILIQCIFRRT